MNKKSIQLELFTEVTKKVRYFNAEKTSSIRKTKGIKNEEIK